MAPSSPSGWITRAPAPDVLRCRVDHTAGRTGGGLALRDLVEQIEVWEPSEVTAALDQAQAAARRGRHVVGYVAYDAAPAFDDAFRVPSPVAGRTTLPLVWFGVFAAAVPVAPLPGPAAPPPGRPGRDWDCEIDARRHEASTDRIRREIGQGNAYLVNYTTRSRRPWTADDDPFDLYRRLVASHGPGYHAFVETEAWAIACGSPELFFDHDGATLLTRPMKGTARRGRWPEEDVRLAGALERSPKERAENVMVVDEIRNDLGRVADIGSVTVSALAQPQPHPSVWQLTSTVAARTGEHVSLADIFGALFPCASVTGTPKIAAMSLIADLEASPRGVYSGAIGLIEPGRPARRPHATFAVAIRTAVVDKIRWTAEFGTGGGITWDSLHDDEWRELLLKHATLAGAPLPALPPGHGLLETLGFLPGGDGGELRNLGRHLARLRASAGCLGLTVPPDLDRRVADAVRGLEAPSRVRIVVRGDGTVQIDTTPLVEASSTVVGLCIDQEPVSSTDATLFHKTTDRRRYDERARRHPAVDDVVLVNERGEVTETCRANLAVWIDGRWHTPALECGLLPGVERGRAIEDGRLVERRLTVAEFRRARAVATLSSLRGWRAAQLTPHCRC